MSNPKVKYIGRSFKRESSFAVPLGVDEEAAAVVDDDDSVGIDDDIADPTRLLSWNCGKCAYVNTPVSRTTCEVCSTPKKEAARGKTGATRQPVRAVTSALGAAPILFESVSPKCKWLVELVGWVGG